MITVYKVIYTKPSWQMGDAISHIMKHCPHTKIDCQETEHCYCFTLLREEEGTATVLLPLTDTVALIVKDLSLPHTPLFPEEVEKEVKEPIEAVQQEEEKA
jgi:hypothetical protein